MIHLLPATILTMKKNKIILFDLDGTLIDSTEAILESFEVAFASFGVKVPDATLIKAEIGHPLEDMFAALGVEPLRVEAYVHAYKSHYREISCAKTLLLPGAKEAIVLAYEEAYLGVVTTKTGLYSVEMLEHMGVMGYFDVLVGREHVLHPKPHPEPIRQALTQLPKVTEGIWMIGDTCMDMQAAEAADVEGIAVLCGYGREELLMKCSSKIVQNSLEAIQFIAKK